jgi:hypothetical protein
VFHIGPRVHRRRGDTSRRVKVWVNEPKVSVYVVAVENSGYSALISVIQKV